MAEYTDQQLRQALCAEYEWLCHDGLEEGDMTQSQYEFYVSKLNREQLLSEIGGDDHYYTLDDFMNHWGESYADS